MVQIVGNYKLERNENLDEFYTAAGVPWIARKIMLTTSPSMEVSQDGDEEECWLFKTVSFMRTVEQSFKLNETYEETMPSGDVFECIATKEGDSEFIIKSTSDEKGNFERHYLFTDTGLIVTMKHPSGVQAKRYFKRA